MVLFILNRYRTACRTLSSFATFGATFQPKQTATTAQRFSRSSIWQNSQSRWQSQFERARTQGRRSYRRQAFNYSRFQSSQNFFYRWSQSPTFYPQVTGLAAASGGFYAYNLETVPISGRRRFNLVSPKYEAQLGEQMYAETMQQYSGSIMPEHSYEHRLVRRVLDRLIPNSGLEDQDWEVHVINSDEENAFVIPGAKVFVFRGILDVCQGEDGLAAVLGHEIAHNVAHHAAERMSGGLIFVPFAMVAAVVMGIDPSIGQWAAKLAIELPKSRSQESEADHIGLQIMAKSCYDPSAAIPFWARMENRDKGAPPQFLSTHPSPNNRMRKIEEWLPKARETQEMSGCSSTMQYAREFRETYDFAKW